MKIIIKEMSADRNKLLVYLMTEDDIPVKCEMTTRTDSKSVIETFTEGEDVPTITYKYPQNILQDE